MWWKAAANWALARSTFPRKAAGIGLGRLEAALIMEAMAYGCPSTSAVHLDPQHGRLDDRQPSAATDVKVALSADLVSMEQIASYCLTEPGSGSDAAALKTTARREATTMSSTAPSSSSPAAERTRSMSRWSAPARTGRKAFPAS
jgi:alkylation response protein AidB-like acyl-CoA dehydrogenase